MKNKTHVPDPAKMSGPVVENREKDLGRKIVKRRPLKKKKD